MQMAVASAAAAKDSCNRTHWELSSLLFLLPLLLILLLLPLAMTTALYSLGCSKGRAEWYPQRGKRSRRIDAPSPSWGELPWGFPWGTCWEGWNDKGDDDGDCGMID